MAVDKFVTKDYLLDQFEGYDREIASNKYITDTVNNLVNYYTKSQTYTQTEVDALIAAAKNGRFIYVTTLPTTDIDIKAIYLVPSSDPEAGNIKDEYINTDGTSAGWELIGSTAIDLSGYVQKSQTAGLLKNDGTVNTTIEGAVTANTSAITAIKDGTNIDSFGDVETALGNKQDTISDLATIRSGASAGTTAIQPSATAGLLKNDGTVDTVTKTDIDVIADEFSSSTLYGKGSYVIYNGELYQFKAQHNAGAWIGTDATKITVGSALLGKSDYFTLSGKLVWDEDFVTKEKILHGLYTPTVTANNENPVTSKGVYNFAFPRNEQAVLGAKNLLPYPFADTTKTVSGITFTDNGNSSITIGGSTSQTATANARFFLFKFKDATTIEAGTYKFTKGFTKAGVQIIIDAFNASGALIKNIVTSENEDIEATIDYNGYTQVSASIVVKNTTVIDSPITALPMYRLATDPDPTYVPHVMTNRELTENINNVFANMINLAFTITSASYTGDLDELDAGIRYCTNATTHNPNNAWGYCFTIKNPFNKIQIFVAQASDGIWYRRYANSWQAWKTVTLS